ncbi:Mor transcription activator family protein [Pseudomonas huaxiensis]|uniref:Mor transcription activator family protein n=1 Tax=Pseudomonas huaxiensis TaxID=2213017 RepID=UPI0013004C15|nr:Mor transcription activator family protein [Pseudomonas huaxiensis]
MTKDTNSSSSTFKGALAAIYSSILERISYNELKSLEPDDLARVATIAIKDSLSGQTHYIHKDRNKARANLKTTQSRELASNNTSNAFSGALLSIYSAVLEKANTSNFSIMSPEQFANRCTLAIQESMGGYIHYIPMGSAEEHRNRDLKICDLWGFGGQKVSDIALKFEVSQQHVYEVLNRYSEKYRSIHSGNRQLRRERNAMLLASRESGATYRQLSQDFGLCYSQVREIIKKTSKATS